MTRERDRIQENANKYIVKNCPAYQKELVTIDFETGETKATDKNYCMNPFLPNKCQDCTDCVIKQVIEECDKIIIYTQNAEIDVMLERSGITDAEKSELYGQCKMARKILNLFDIEEIRE